MHVAAFCQVMPEAVCNQSLQTVEHHSQLFRRLRHVGLLGLGLQNIVPAAGHAAPTGRQAAGRPLGVGLGHIRRCICNGRLRGGLAVSWNTNRSSFSCRGYVPD